MPNIQYSLVVGPHESVVTVFEPGRLPAVAQSDHPAFKQIVATLTDPDTPPTEEVFDLFDISARIENSFREALSGRVSVKDDKIFLDHDEVETALSDQILLFLQEGHDVQPLVRFLERMEANPTEHSRKQGWEWLNRHDFTLTPDGEVVMYKGVRSREEDGEVVYESITHGPAIVNGQEVDGAVPNNPGDVVEISRSKVVANPHVGCASGLHAGSWEYAHDFAAGAVLEVHVSPEDIVSVPTDCSWAKVRTCRYKVVKAIDAPHTAGLLDVDGPDVEETDDDQPAAVDFLV